MSVGVQKLDDQHKLMIDEIAELYLIRKDRDAGNIRRLFLLLIDNVIEHFSNEEIHMKNLQYNKVNDHIEVHRTFVSDIKNMADTLNSKDVFEIGDNYLNFIARWLGNHILVEDKDYAMYAQHRQNLP